MKIYSPTLFGERVYRNLPFGKSTESPKLGTTVNYYPMQAEDNFHYRVWENVGVVVNTSHSIEQIYRYADTDEEVPKIPDPSLFQFDATGQVQDGVFKLPSIAECAAHLEFLTTLATLRCNVLNSAPINRTMGFTSEARPSQMKVAQWQQQKWTKFVEFAVVRFLAWRSSMHERHKVGKMSKEMFEKEEANVMPVDVLMVWSVFMLNPGLYEMHCSKELIYDLGIPWKAVHASIYSREDWLWIPSNKFKGVIGALGLGDDLFQMFELWEFPTEQTQGKQYPGLNEFEFTRQSVIHKKCPDPEHKKLVDRYVKAFSNVDFTLAHELNEAVLRQELFWRKMVDQMWIRSPAVEGTLRRAIGRYDKFMEIMKRNPKTQIVPTLDIDLVWHTHQCSGGRAYAVQTEARTGQFVNHNDKLGQGSLVLGYGSTRQLYQQHFGAEYRICGCWECELMISEMEKAVDLAPGNLHMDDIVQKIKEKMLFYRAVEVMRRDGKRLPAVRK